MSQTVDIGAARIHLIVDADDVEPTLRRMVNTAKDFGTAAEQAFDRSSGKARTAANRLLDYVATLGRAESQLERMVRQASRAGVEAPIIAAAVTAYKNYEAQLRATADEQKRLNDEAARASSVGNLRNQLQEKIGASMGAGDQYDGLEREASRLGASATLNPLIEQLRRLDAEQKEAALSARLLGDAWDAATRENAEFDRQLEKTMNDAIAINARIDTIRNQLQEKIGASMGAGDQYDGLEREAQRLGAGQTLGPYIAQIRQVEQAQREATAALQAQVAAENAVEAEARQIHAQWVAIDKQIAYTTGKMSSYDLQRANVTQQFGAVAAKPLIDHINLLEKLNTNTRGATVNTKQLQQAIRFLPAQFTDIGVSLAGGMNPLLVAFQQGGQILDQFRLAGATTGDTLSMIGSHASKLITPWTAATAVLAGFAYTAYDAAKAQEKLGIASAKGFGIAGDAGQLTELAESLNKLENIRLGPAEEAVARLAAGGRLAGENMRMAAEASARWASITGESIDQATSQFDAIARDPLQAIESGLIRVTEAQYNQVRALVAVGDQQGAVNTLTKIWFDTLNSASSSAEASLSGVSRLLQSIKDDFSEAGRYAGNFANTIIDRVGEANVKLLATGNLAQAAIGIMARLRAGDVDTPAPKSNAPLLYDPAAAKRTKDQANEIATFLATGDEKAQRAITLNRIWENGERLKIDFNTTAQIIARQEKLWKEQDAKRNKRSSGGGGTGARTAARDVRYEYQLESALLQTQTREVQAAYAIKSITAEAYYKSLITLAEKEYDVQKRSNAEQLAAIGGKKGQEHEVARLRVADAIAEQQLAQRKIDIQSQQAQYAQQLLQQRRDYTNALWDGVAAQQADFDSALKRMTMGDREFERWNAENELIQEQDRLLRDIRRQVESKAISAEEGARREQIAIDATNAKLMQQAAAYGQIDVARGNWENGASRAWKNWQDEVTDVAGHSEKVFGEAFGTFAEIGTDALTGNLKSWGDYFDSLARMITQFIVKQQLTKWMQSLSQGAGGGGGWWDKAASFAAGLLGGGGGFQASSGGVSGSDFAAVFDDFMGGMATGGTVRPGAFAQVNERGFEMARVGNRDYLLAGAKPVQITPNHKIAAAARGPSSRVVNIQQTFVVQGTPDRSTRDQLRRDNAGATQRSVAKV